MASAKKNDIALIRLNSRVFFSDVIRPACLNTRLRDEEADVKLTVSGWGLLSQERKFDLKDAFS